MGHRAYQECEFQLLLEEASAEKVTSEPQMWVLTWRTLGSEILWGHKCKAWIRRGFSRAAGAWTSPGMTRTGVFETGTQPTGNAGGRALGQMQTPPSCCVSLLCAPIS